MRLVQIVVDVSGFTGCSVAGGSIAKSRSDERMESVCGICCGVSGDASGGDAVV